MTVGFQAALVARGFEVHDLGGGTQALVRRRGTVTDVVTDLGGLGLPTVEDWHFCTYLGDWTLDPGADQPLAALTSDEADRPLFYYV